MKEDIRRTWPGAWQSGTAARKPCDASLHYQNKTIRLLRRFRTALRNSLRLLLRRAVRLRRSDGGLISRMKRVAPEPMLDIGDEQFLVLLLMVQPQRDQFCTSAPPRRIEQLEHVLIHVRAILADFVQSGARECIAQRFFRLLPNGVVIGVKKIAKLRMERPVSGQMLGKNNVSKNQLVCAMCHLAGLASGQDCTIKSSALRLRR